MYADVILTIWCLAFCESGKVRIALRWGLILSFTTGLWLARLSIVFSIIRIAPREHRVRRIAQWAAALFAGLCVVLLAQKTYVCGHDSSWYHHEELIDCRLGSAVAAVQLASKTRTLILLLSRLR